mgnify:CR=1 FL=1
MSPKNEIKNKNRQKNKSQFILTTKKMSRKNESGKKEQCMDEKTFKRIVELMSQGKCEEAKKLTPLKFQDLPLTYFVERLLWNDSP